MSVSVTVIKLTF